MKLSETQKQSLLTSAIDVYQGYLALDFFKNNTWQQMDGQEKTLLELCQEQMRANNTAPVYYMLNGHAVSITLTPSIFNQYTISITPSTDLPTPKCKSMGSYSDIDQLALLANQRFTIENNEAMQVANRIGSFQLGGEGKIDLYRTHLITLFNIIKKINQEEDISNLLVALATGSGKTYVQALWMLLIVARSGSNGVFAVPDKLLVQMQKDIKRLLPENLVNSIAIIRDNSADEYTHGVLADLVGNEAEGKIILTSSERILDKHFDVLKNADPNKTFICFDEQHLLMQTERRRVRLIELSKRLLSMFLTATPNTETYKLSGNKPVASMSSGQKEQAGQGLFPSIFRENARNISDRNQLNTLAFWRKDFWQNLYDGFLLRLSNAIEQEHSSVGFSIIENLPYYLERKENEPNARWRLQVPMARKMLCIVDDNEALVNLTHMLQGQDRVLLKAIDDSNYIYSEKERLKQNIREKEKFKRNVYVNGNLVNRRDIAKFFMLPAIDERLVKADEERAQAEYIANLQEDEKTVGEALVKRSVADQMKKNILHNMIEYVLMDLTGLTQIEHNRLRKKNPHAFVALIRSKLTTARSVAYYENQLTSQLDATGAHDVAVILNEVSQMVHQEKDRDLDIVADNWSLSKAQVFDTFMRYTSTFKKYADSHLMIGMMQGMKDAETPVEERPFSGMEEDRYPLYNKNGLFSDKAKKRQHSTMENLNDQTMESRFTPNYLEGVDETICDNYFRLGFVGIYVSNKKTEGFSDSNLHTVINLSPTRLSSTNNPETLIQGIGRNRGLDETAVPIYIHALGRKEKTIFNLNHLTDDDYYPPLFKAQNKFNKEYIQSLGEEVGNQVIHWVCTHVENDETINNEQLKKHVLKTVAKTLRKINNSNSHNIKLSRAQLRQVISQAMQVITTQMDKMNHPYQASLFVRTLGSVLNFISEAGVLFKRVRAYYRLRNAVVKEDIMPAEKTYINILNSTNYKTLVKNVSISKEFQDWISRKHSGILLTLRKKTDQYIDSDAKRTLAEHYQQTLWPLIGNLVVPNHRQQVLAAMQSMPNLLSFLYQNRAIFEKLLTNSEDNFEQNALAFFQQVPGLEDIKSESFISYEQQKAAFETIDFTNPLKIAATDDLFEQRLTQFLGEYLSGDFLVHAERLLLQPDFIQLKNKLSPANASQLVLHLVHVAHTNPSFNINKVEDFLTQVKAFLGLESLATAQERAQQFEKNAQVVMNHVGKASVEQVKKNVVAYLQSNLVNKAQAFFLYPDMLQLEQAFSLEKIEAFVQHFATQLQERGDTDLSNINPQHVLQDLIAFFELRDVKLANERIMQFGDTLTQQFETIQANKIAHLNDESMEAIVRLVHMELLPSMVNAFPYKDRAELLRKATPEKVRAFIEREGQTIADANNLSVRDIPRFFAGIIGEPVPACINIATTQNAAKKYFADQQKYIKDRCEQVVKSGVLNMLAVAWSSAFDKSAKSAKIVKDTIAAELDKMLISEAFLENISLLLPFNQLQLLKVQLQIPQKRQVLVRELSEKISNDQLDFASPNALVALFNRTLNTEFLGTEAQMQSGKEQLFAKLNTFAQNPLISLKPSTKQNVAQLACTHVLPIMASFLSTWEQKKAFCSQHFSDDTLIQFLLNNASQLQNIEQLNSRDQQQMVWTLIQQLGNQTRLGREDIIDPMVKAEQEKRQLETDLTSMMNPQNVLSFLETSNKSELVKLIREQFLPLLAMFIDKTELRTAFLNKERDDETIIQFITNSKDQLGDFANLSGEEQKRGALELMNRLDNDLTLQIGDLILPEREAKSAIESIKSDFEERVLGSYMGSNIASKMLGMLYNESDCQKIKLAMQNQQLAITTARALHSEEDLSLDVIQNYIGPLADVSSLKERADDFMRFAEGLEDQFDRVKAGSLVRAELAPVLFHEEFIQAVDGIVGKLTSADLANILRAKQVDEADTKAAELMAFLTCIRKQDITHFGYNIESNLDSLAKVTEEILDCHCYFNYHDRTGVVKDKEKESELPKPNLPICAALKAIHVDEDHSDFSKTANKIFFIQGLRNGLAQKSRVNADANQHIAKVLQRVNKHILNPLWWTIDRFSVTHTLIKGARSISQGIENVRFGFLNAIKRFFNYVAGDSFTISKRNKHSEDFNDSAFSFSKKMNKLKPLTVNEAAVSNCPEDVVTYLEAKVDKKRKTPRFFQEEVAGNQELLEHKATCEQRVLS